MTPLVVLTGALGAGKTTLLGRCLAMPEFARTAVVIDELGDVEVDRYLLPSAPAALRRSCGGRWVEALAALARSEEGFERVVVEANGVATPASIVEALDDAQLEERFALDGIVAAVDVQRGGDGLESDALARSHAVAADAIVLTKLDLADDAAARAVAAAIARLNPYAGIVRGTDPALATQLCEAARMAPCREARRLQGWVDANGDAGIGALVVRFTQAVELSGFSVRLAAFLEQHADRILRVKGLVRVEGRKGPAVIQAVGPTLYPVRTLKAWPQGVTESALVVIARGMPDDELRIGVESAGAPRRKARAK